MREREKSRTALIFQPWATKGMMGIPAIDYFTYMRCYAKFKHLADPPKKPKAE